MSNEGKNVLERYKKRNKIIDSKRYSLISISNLLSVQERQREIIFFLKKFQKTDFSNLKLLEVGSGSGNNLLEFLRIGFQPENIVGVELITDRASKSRYILPSKVTIIEGDATSINIEPGSIDIIFISVVFSSLLDNSYQEILSKKIWTWLKPGGSVLIYDFIYNNPMNKHVRGVPVKRINELFPSAKISIKKITIAPPVARRFEFFNGRFLFFLHYIPFLKSHALSWVQKQI